MSTDPANWIGDEGAFTIEAEDPKTKFDSRLGRCYELSGRKVMDTPGSVLVHGTIQGYGYPRNPYAWVILPDNTMWEPVTETEWEPDGFYRFYNAVPTITYGRDMAIRMMGRSKHFGPWEAA